MAVKSIKKQPKDVVVWVRVPKGIPINKLRGIGLEASSCHGGDTCICAPVFTESAGIVVQGPKGLKLQELFKKAGFTPRAECFGGDACIV